MNSNEEIRARIEELKRLHETTDEYEITVVFQRNFGDDIPHLAGSDMPIGKALLNQFVRELQEAFDKGGMAGHFRVVAGPSMVLGKHSESEYTPIAAVKQPNENSNASLGKLLLACESGNYVAAQEALTALQTQIGGAGSLPEVKRDSKSMFWLGVP